MVDTEQELPPQLRADMAALIEIAEDNTREAIDALRGMAETGTRGRVMAVFEGELKRIAEMKTKYGI